MKNHKSYVGKPDNCRQGSPFVPFARRGFTSLEVLPFLKGKPWDDVALGFVHSLRPSHIRVTDGGIQLDAQTWRVTVTVSKKNKIEKIEQEVEVGLPVKVVHGSALHCALEYGVDSPQTKWHAIPGGYVYNGITGESYKVDDAGTRHDWPKPKNKRNK